MPDLELEVICQISLFFFLIFPAIFFDFFFCPLLCVFLTSLTNFPLRFWFVWNAGCTKKRSEKVGRFWHFRISYVLACNFSNSVCSFGLSSRNFLLEYRSKIPNWLNQFYFLFILNCFVLRRTCSWRIGLRF